jgi:LacI family repressor for deo operon, udp, cdd, tsx, nupC, and nupG
MSKMKDVARLANVSTATVSRVLAGEERVTERTKEKVLQAIEQLHYKPNRLASNLRTLKSKTIVVVVRDISNSFFSDIIRGVEDVAYKHNYKVLLGDTRNDPKKESDYIGLYNERLVDGVILIATRNRKDTLNELTRGIPVVLTSEFLERADMPIVSIDNIGMAKLATEHLISLGHNRIGFISGPRDIAISKDRLMGYHQALLEHELPLHPDLIQEGDWSIESGHSIASRLLKLDSRPTAILASNDEMAIGVIKCVKKAGLRVPQDVAVVGFDNINMASLLEPTLTTISQPRYDIGVKVMEILLKLMNGEAVKEKQYILPSKLIIRESCGGVQMNGSTSIASQGS